MQSGFNTGRGGGGLPEYYTGGEGARSIGIGNTMNNNHPSQPQYRSHLSNLFMDSSQNPASLIGKRSLSEFQFQQNHQQNPANNQNMYLRSMKARTTLPYNFQHSSPIDFSSATSYTGSDNNSISSTTSQRYTLPPLLQQQLRPNPITNPAFHVSSSSSPYVSNNFQALHNNQKVSVAVSSIETEKKMIDDRLLELEKQLLDDNDDEEEGGDGVSGITKADSEWCETIQNLMSPNQTTIPTAQPSPTTSSSSVASLATLTCTKQALMEAASAISEGKPEAAVEILTRFTHVSNPKPNSEQRLLEMMTSALKSRVNMGENPAPVKELFSDGHAASTQVLNELLPCFRLGFVAANMAILEATLPEETTTTTNKVHVIDFDIGHGGQYLHLLHALSTRQNGKPSVVKITTVADSTVGEERLRRAREKLTQTAKQLHVGLEFHVVSHPKLSELSREALGCEPDEPIAVNFAFKLYTMPDESVSTDNPRDEFLRRVKSLAPRVVTLVEQELNTNTAPFVTCVSECCAYYGAMLDLVEAVAKDSGLDRVKAEEAVSRKVINSVACEGRDRVERCEVFGKWRARMGMAGFELRPMSQSVAKSLKNRLSHPSFTVNEINGAVSFGWVNRTLTVASAWR